MTDKIRASYDATPYDSKPISASHTEHLATIARLYGIPAASPDECRVLELGCASGGNIIPIAFRYPRSTFLGVDLSPAQVSDGQRTVDALGLTNVKLETRSIVDLDASVGSFDYIICHGVFSWVPPDVQDAILRVCKACLAPNGIAYVSYNTYPGWHARMTLRHMMLTNDDRSLPPLERVTRARAYVERVGARAAAIPGPYAAAFHQELETLRSQNESHILHEQLEDFNSPLLFREFATRAASYELQYVADARIPSSMWPDPEVHAVPSADGIIQREQEADFVIGQTFRRSLLCRAGRLPDLLSATTVLRDFHAFVRAVPVPPSDAPDEQAPGVRVFRAPEGYRLGTSSSVLLALFDELGAVAPATVAVRELERRLREHVDDSAQEEVDGLPALLLRLARAGMIGLMVSPSPFTTQLSVRPTASGLARWQAGQRAPISDLRHVPVKVPPLAVFLLPYLDGTRDREQLVAEVQRALDDGRMAVPMRPNAVQIGSVVDEALRHLASSALLVS